jgi:transposase
MSIDQDTRGYIRYLHLKEGYSIRAIARKTGAARQTIRQILSAKPPKTTRTKSSKLDQFKVSIESILKEKPGFSSVLILEKLRQQGYRGGKSSVYDFIRKISAHSVHVLFLVLILLSQIKNINTICAIQVT